MKRFVIVGSGYRSLFYVRIAKALPKEFELLAMLCRTESKASMMREEHNIYTTCSEAEILAMKPDFIVCAVDKKSMNEVALYYASKGMTVISETPAALSYDGLCNTFAINPRMIVAEQYIRYPYFKKLIETVRSNIIGEINSIHISTMHDYHAASVIRHIFDCGLANVSITGKCFMTNVTDTKTRYETITDGRISAKEEKHLVMEYETGQVAFYDFMSDQYRSPIRNKHILVRGTRGEICDDLIYYLDDNNLPASKKLNVINPYEDKGLNEDEAAIASLMMDIGKDEYPLSEALEDAYIALLMDEATINPYVTARSCDRPWA